MSLFTSTHFASAAAQGKDWRDTSKNVLEKLEHVRMRNSSFNLGFLYISDHLADDATSILNLFRSVLGVEHWVGSIGMGVLGCGEAFIDQPAIAAMVGHFPQDSFCIFPKTDEFQGSEKHDTQAEVKAWLAQYQPMLSVVHADPMAQDDPTMIIQNLERGAHAFVVGGLTSSRAQHYQIADVVCENTVSGVFFADSVPVASMLSQGCVPINEAHTISRADNHLILEIDGRKALDVFQDDLRALAAQRLGKDRTEFKTDLRTLSVSDQIPQEFLPLFQGQIHVALTDSHSDQKDFMVRNITGINADNGSMTIAQGAVTGARILFVERTQETVIEDLSRNLVQMRARITHERGGFYPKAGLYFSCIARGFGAGDKNYEMDMIRTVIGDLPLAGFFAGGEISNAKLYGYTGVLVLFF